MVRFVFMRMVTFAEDASEALMKLVWWILYTTPVGVFGLVAPVTAKLGWDLLQSLAVFIVCVGVGLIIYTTLIMLPLVKLVEVPSTRESQPFEQTATWL